eukprot:13763219-Ditylum_brightwellii.AAC.1
MLMELADTKMRVILFPLKLEPEIVAANSKLDILLEQHIGRNKSTAAEGEVSKCSKWTMMNTESNT